MFKGYESPALWNYIFYCSGKKKCKGNSSLSLLLFFKKEKTKQHLVCMIIFSKMNKGKILFFHFCLLTYFRKRYWVVFGSGIHNRRLFLCLCIIVETTHYVYQSKLTLSIRYKFFIRRFVNPFINSVAKISKHKKYDSYFLFFLLSPLKAFV